MLTECVRPFRSDLIDDVRSDAFRIAWEVDVGLACITSKDLSWSFSRHELEESYKVIFHLYTVFQWNPANDGKKRLCSV